MTPTWLLKDTGRRTGRPAALGSPRSVGPARPKAGAAQKHEGPGTPRRGHPDHGHSWAIPLLWEPRAPRLLGAEETHTRPEERPRGPEPAASLTMSVFRSARSAGFLMRLERRTGWEDKAGPLAGGRGDPPAEPGWVSPVPTPGRSEAWMRQGTESAPLPPCWEGTTPGDGRARGMGRGRGDAPAAAPSGPAATRLHC